MKIQGARNVTYARTYAKKRNSLLEVRGENYCGTLAYAL